jgi:hypothetical protein
MMRMRIRIRRKKHRKALIDQRRMWRTAGIVGDINGYECDNADADEEQEALQADD